MKPSVQRALMVGVAVLLAASACSRTKPDIAPLPRSTAAADSLFQQADRKYQSGALPEALTLFNDYLNRYPAEPLAPSALMRIGTIQLQLGNGAQARAAYQRLAADYPSSPLRPEALIEGLRVLLREGQFEEVVAQSREAQAAAAIPAQRARVFAVRGDAQAGLGRTLEAVLSYTLALQLAAPSEQEGLIPKLRAAILALSPEAVRALAQLPDGDVPMDYLLFQAGVLLAREGRPQDGRLLLEAFRERYPAHDQYERAERALAEIPAAAAAERTVGCLLPLSGDYQSIGQKALRGIELAAATHNAAGRTIVNVLVKDTQSDAGRTLEALQQLERENAFAVVGPIVHAEAVSREAQQMGMPLLTVTQREGVVGVGDYVFRNFITPAAQMRSLAAYAVGTLGVVQAVVLYPDEPYGRTFMTLFRDELGARGGEVLLSVAYSPDATDFSTVIKRLLRYAHEVPKEGREGRPERKDPPPGSRRSRHLEEKETELVFDFQAIFIPDEPKKVGMLVPQLAYHDIRNVQLLGTNLWHSEALIRYAEPYVQGAVMPDAFFASSPDPAVQRFVSAFQESYQEAPGFIEAVAFDSASILFDVLSRPGVRTRRDVAAALHAGAAFPGATGRTRFDANGDCDKELHILTVKGKKFVELE